MKNKKKVIALFIAMFMVFSLVPSYAVQANPQLPDGITISEDADAEPASEKGTLEETTIEDIQINDSTISNKENTVLEDNSVDKEKLAENSKKVEKAVTDSAIKAVSKNSGMVKVPPWTSLATVLYSDGTLIINEDPIDRSINQTKHGSVNKEYLPWGNPELFMGVDDYVFDNFYNIPWVDEITQIQYVEFGSSVNPTSTRMWFRECINLKSIDFTNLDTSEVTDMSEMFYACTSLENINMTTFSTSNVKYMSDMFHACYSLTELDLSSFNTSKVTDMSNMFVDCHELSYLNAETFSFSNDPDVSDMFWNCYKLSTTLYINFPNNGTCLYPENTPFNETGTESEGDIYLIPLNITSATWCNKFWSSIYVEDYYSTVLYNDGTLIINAQYLDSSHGDVVKEYKAWGSEDTVTTDDYVFTNQSQVPWYGDRLSISRVEFDSSVKPTSTAYWFYGLSNLKEISFTHLNTSSLTNMQQMFRNCEKLAKLDLSNFNTSQVTKMSHVFYNCSSISSLDLKSFDTAKVEDMSYMFCGCSALKTITVDDSFNTSNVKNMSYMFRNANNVEGGTKDNPLTLDLSNTTNVSYMFDGCENAKYFNLEVGTKTPTSKNYVFNNAATNVGENEGITLKPSDTQAVTWCLEQIDAYGPEGYRTKGNIFMEYPYQTVLYTDGTFIINEHRNDRDTNIKEHGAVVNTYLAWGEENTDYTDYTDDYVFYNNNLPIWNNEAVLVKKIEFGSSVTPKQMACWFMNMANLTEIDFANLDTSQTTNMNSMFAGCTSLQNVDLSSLETAKVTDMNSMFSGCTNLSSLDLSNFDTNNVNDMAYMFRGCSNLTSLDLSNFDFGNVTDIERMFYNCNNLSMTWILNNIPSNYVSILTNAATEENAEIILIPTSAETEDWAKELIGLYGSAGTESQGNIHLPYIDVTINESINFSADAKGNISDTITIKNNGLCKISSKMSMNLSNGWEIVPNTSYITGKDQKKATLALNGTSLASANASNLEIESGASSQLTLNGKVGIFTKAIDEEFGKLVLEIENKYYSTNVYLSDEKSMDDTLVFSVQPELEDPLNTLIKIWRSPDGIDDWEVWNSGVIGDGDNLLWRYNSPYFNLGFVGSVFGSDYWKVSVVVNDKEHDSNVITFGPQLIISYDQQNNILEATMKKITATSYNWEISFDNGKTWQDYPNGNSSSLTPEKNGIYRCTAIANGKSYQSGTITFTDKF